MDRRKALKALIGSISVGAFVKPTLGGETAHIHNYGAIPTPAKMKGLIDSAPNAGFHEKFRPFKGLARDSKNVLLYKDLEKDIGKIVPHSQSGDPSRGIAGEGDCVAQALAFICDLLASINRHTLGKREDWIAKSSVEMIYAGSRIQVGKLGTQQETFHYDISGREGSHGAWGTLWLKEYGVLHRIKYGNYDLSGYSADRSRMYRDSGVPSGLIDIAKKHPVLEVSKIRGVAEACDAIVARQPLAIFSSYAVENIRDSQGFSRIIRGNVRRTRFGFFDLGRTVWNHAMLFMAKVDFSGRIGLTLMNSHGLWNSGPQPNDMPDGSCNLSLEDVQTMIDDWGECYALSGYRGSEAKRLKHKLY